MIQKNITLQEYVQKIAKVMADEQSEMALRLGAKMFFRVFEKEVSEKLQQAFDAELEGKESEEYYKILVIFFTNIGSDCTRKFLGYLALEMKEKNEG